MSFPIMNKMPELAVTLSDDDDDDEVEGEEKKLVTPNLNYCTF